MYFQAQPQSESKHNSCVYNNLHQRCVFSAFSIVAMNDIGVYKLRYHSFFPHFALNSYRIEFCCHVCRIKYEITRVLCKVSENDVDISWFMLCLPLLLLDLDLRCILFSIKIKSGHSVGVCCCCIHCCRHHIAHR